MTYLAKVNPRRRRNAFFPAAFDPFFDEVANQNLKNNFVAKLPAVNVVENEQAFKLEVAVPGLKKEDISLRIEEDMLTISAAVTKEAEETTDKYTRREFNFNEFTRKFQLNETIDVEQIAANFEDGILKITLPKVVVEEKINNREITIA